jgi:hypothetical protein
MLLYFEIIVEKYWVEAAVVVVSYFVVDFAIAVVEMSMTFDLGKLMV